jgi:hypothetical protein
MKYDATSFYLLFDVTSDVGKSSSHRMQFILLSFDTNNDGFSTNDTQNDFFMTFSVNGTRLVFEWFGTRPHYVGEILAAQSLGSSPNLDAPHRIYELSIPTSIVFRDNLTTIGFNACANDSYGNLMCLTDPQNPPFQIELTFAQANTPTTSTIAATTTSTTKLISPTPQNSQTIVSSVTPTTTFVSPTASSTNQASNNSSTSNLQIGSPSNLTTFAAISLLFALAAGVLILSVHRYRKRRVFRWKPSEKQGSKKS